MTQGKLYNHVLVPVDNSPTDDTIIEHVSKLAQCFGAKITLIHVADGFMARNQARLAESPEMESDKAYLETRKVQLTNNGLDVDTVLVCGEPAGQIISFLHKSDCDLVAMATHGHTGLNDLILGSVATTVRHKTNVPILLINAAPKKR